MHKCGLQNISNAFLAYFLFTFLNTSQSRAQPGFC